MAKRVLGASIAAALAMVCSPRQHMPTPTRTPQTPNSYRDSLAARFPTRTQTSPSYLAI
jgi:hypothetical protein